MEKNDTGKKGKKNSKKQEQPEEQESKVQEDVLQTLNKICSTKVIPQTLITTIPTQDDVQLRLDKLLSEFDETKFGPLEKDQLTDLLKANDSEGIKKYLKEMERSSKSYMKKKEL